MAYIVFKKSPRLISSLKALTQVSFRTTRANHSGLRTAQSRQTLPGGGTSILPMTLLASLLEVYSRYGALFLNCPNILFNVFRLSLYFQNLFAYLMEVYPPKYRH